MGFAPISPIAIKLSTGEPGGHNYLKPELIKDLVQGLDGTIAECNTAYGGRRSSTKAHLETAGKPSTSWQSAPQNDFLDSMAEAAQAVVNALNGSIAYVNVTNNLSVDCDCDSYPADPDMADIGIFASLDPVAIDQACVDAVYASPDGASLIERIESRNGMRTLEYGEQIGLGSRAYRLEDLDA